MEMCRGSSKEMVKVKPPQINTKEKARPAGLGDQNPARQRGTSWATSEKVK